MEENIKKFLTILKKKRIKYIVVGNSAAVLSGAEVMTQDFDVWIKNVSFKKLKSVAKTLKGTFIFSESTGCFIILPGTEVADIITTVHGVGTFEDELKKAKWIKFGSIEVPVLSLDSIIKSKQYLKRGKDKSDLPRLKSFRKFMLF